jgi:hypothetical protein
MFEVSRDERLRRIDTESAATAFLLYFFLVLGLMIVRGFVHVEVLSDPDFLLLLPWLLAGLTYLATGMRKGFYAAVREENTRTGRRRLESRMALLLSVIMVTMIMFVFKYFDVFGSDEHTTARDLMDAAVFGVLWGALQWALYYRRSRVGGTRGDAGGEVEGREVRGPSSRRSKRVRETDVG